MKIADIRVRISEEMKRELDEEAEREGVTFSDVVRKRMSGGIYVDRVIRDDLEVMAQLGGGDLESLVYSLWEKLDSGELKIREGEIYAE